MKPGKKIALLIVILFLIACGRNAPPVPPQPSLKSILITPSSGTYQLPATQQFTAKGQYSDGTTKDITGEVKWYSSDISVATISNSAGSQGMATMVGSGRDVISADSGSLQSSVTIGVTSSVTVSVSPSFASVTVSHQTEQFTVVVQGTSDNGVVWSVDGIHGGNTMDGIISDSGVYTPPSTEGLHTITATSDIDISKSASATVAVMGDPGVFTRNYNTARTSQNTDEIVLTPQNVNSKQFGKLFSYTVDGGIYAQPLYVANVKLADNTYHNIIYVATINDTVYAFDADNPSVGLIWKRRLVDASNGEVPVPCADVNACGFYGPEVGITGTPVIDPATGTLYVDAFSEANGKYYQKLHALDIATGDEKPGSPVAIEGSVPGTGQGGNGATVTFNPYYQLQRPALLLANGMIYIGFASYGDIPPFHGWLFAYDVETLKQVAIFNTTPDGEDGGIWQSGNGPAADSSGNVYIMTGNGDFNANSTGGRDYGDSFVKLSPGLSVQDYFTPCDQAILNENDVDLGSGGPVLLPDQSGQYPHLLIGGGKAGVLYLLNRDNLGKYNSTDNSQIVQSVSGQITSLFGNAAYWNGNLYFQSSSDYLKMFSLKNGVLSTTPVSQGQYVTQFPGLTPAVSANGNQNGIVWTQETALSFNEPAILRAYNATDLSTELYDSDQAANGRDLAGLTMKFQIPTVVNGKVYVATNGELDVYGLLPQQ